MSRRGYVNGWRAALVLLAVALAACGQASNGAASTPTAGDGGEATDGGATSNGGTGEAEGLCGVFTEDLAVAALGEPVAETGGGEVVPRPNGIYCRHSATDGNVNVEAQLKDMSRAEFGELAGTLGMTEPLDDIGEAAFQLERSTMGGAGASVAAFTDGRGVTVILNGEGDPATQVAALAAIARAALDS